MRTLTPSQQSAVLFNEGDSAVLAGAGSGKTSVIVEKVAVLVERLHVPAQKILVVTFTEKAAAEVKERIRKRLKQNDDAPTVSTIHAYAADTLRADGGSLGLAPDFRILNDFLTTLEKGRSVREKTLSLVEEEDAETLDAVGRFGFRRTIKLFLDLLAEPAHRRGSHPFRGAFEAVRAHYGERKTALGALDFDDLEHRVLKLLKSSPQTFAHKFSWIIVDEFQDTSPLQWEILDTLRQASGARLVIVGDPRQSIYRFRGADPTLFLQVGRNLEKNGGKLLELAENFRSARELVAFVNAVGEPLFAEKFPPMKAMRTDEGKVERLWIEDGPAAEFRAGEARAVTGRFKELRNEGHLWKTMALLFKTRKAVPAYEEALKAEGIPYRTSLGEPLLERPEILTLLFWMQKRAGASENETAFLNTALQHSALKDFSEDLELNPLSAYLDGLFEKIQPLFSEALQRNIKAFQNLTKDLMSLGVGHLKALVQNLKTLREEEARIPCPDAVDDKADAVSILTVHGAKGLEWPIVAVCDLKAAPARQNSLYLSNDDGELLLKEGDSSAAGLKTQLVKTEAFAEKENQEREEGLEESKRLLYVALTRARDRLILPLPVARADGKEKGRRPSSRWSDWLTL